MKLVQTSASTAVLNSNRSILFYYNSYNMSHINVIVAYVSRMIYVNMGLYGYHERILEESYFTSN